eukprot:TRINITY_DN51983_c0_g1_i1.p1 TRINITY_DN51983_c0_g1~~TRINITY_DN51983_c0_g1_i1.p1  ORF type:complete len:142 (-),score=26.42 TRINITY_DN51983_c0_g1_i1:71-496(-)
MGFDLAVTGYTPSLGASCSRPSSRGSLCNATTSSGSGSKPGSASSSSRSSLLALEDTGNVPLERAKAWTPQVEDYYRLQYCGWRDAVEYEAVHGPVSRWPADHQGHSFIDKVQVKANGYFTYWRKWRQCEDRDVFKVRVPA